MLEVNAHPAITCVTLFQQAPLAVRQLCQDSTAYGLNLAEVLLWTPTWLCSHLTDL